MFQKQKTKVQLVLREVLAKAEGVMPRGNRFSTAEILLQEKLTIPACMENIIWEYAGKWTDFDVIRDELREHLNNAVSALDSYQVSPHFRFNDQMHKIHVEPMPDNSYMVNFLSYNDRRMKWGCSFSFHATDLDSDCGESSGTLASTLLCDMRCRRVMCQHLLLGDFELYCNECRFNMNSTPCKGCGCRFGAQENGYHEECR